MLANAYGRWSRKVFTGALIIHAWYNAGENHVMFTSTILTCHVHIFSSTLAYDEGNDSESIDLDNH